VIFYLSKYGFIDPQLTVQPEQDLGICIVIPCFNEPDLISTLESLEACKPTSCAVEVIVVVNSGEHHEGAIKRQNQRTIAAFKDWKETQSSSIDFHLIHQPDLPKKHAGVGLARKIGMDEAVYRFYQLNRDGIIVCFDADSKCDPNYLVEIEKHFLEHPKSPGCSIYYEHPIDGEEFDHQIYEGIINYELHLRYYNQALKYAGLPYAFHTVGSSMAVRSSAYQKQGGMNKRKAGEDFYFIHKIIALGNFSELNTTRVIPSPRVSDRVPFGTGKAVGDWVETKERHYFTYSFESFKEIKKFVDFIPLLYEGKYLNELEVSDAFKEFVLDQGLEKAVEEAKGNTTSYPSFLKRFYVWFDAFKVLKLVHHLRDNEYHNVIVENAVKDLLNGLDLATTDLLEILRQKDRSL
jgi:glycosyltransferase involved in cell wall biosynthesis